MAISIYFLLKNLFPMSMIGLISAISNRSIISYRIEFYFRLSDPNDKPLVVLLSWLLSKHKHLSKFIEIYIEKGYDVVTVTITPCQLLFPTKGSHVNLTYAFTKFNVFIIPKTIVNFSWFIKFFGKQSKI